MKKTLRLLTSILGFFIATSSMAQYCTTGSLLYSSGCGFGDDLDNVTIGTFSQTSTGCTTGGFADYTSDTISLQQATPHVISITSNFSSQFYALWIDANNDSDFVDAGEFIWFTTVGSNAANSTFTIPLTIPVGTYRMRLRGKYAGSAMTAADPCTSFSYGEVHDYTLNVLPPPPCPPPFGFTTSNITSTSVDLSYQTNGTKFYIEYGPCGFTQGTGQIDTVTTSTATLSGLLPNTNYEAYVQSDCSAGGNGISTWSSAGCFKTACVGVNEGYSTGFDGLASNDKDPCWADLSYGGPHNVYAVTPSSFSNVQPTSPTNVYYWYNNAATHSYIMTPELIGLDGDTTQMKVKMASNYFTFNPAMKVFIGTMSDRSDTSSIVWTDTVTPAQYVWNEYTILFTNVPAGHKYIVFGRDNAVIFSEIDIEDFKFQGIPSCMPPTNVSSSALSSTSGMVSWTGTGVFDFEYGPSGFTQGTGLTITGATNPDTLTGLFANTCYDVYVRQDCGGGSYSPWELTTFCTPCAASPMPYLEDFTSWPPTCFVLSNTTGWNWIGTSGHAEASFWSQSTGIAYMTSGPITINQKAQVKFKWAHSYNTSYPDDRLILRARVVGSPVWDTLKDLVGPTFNSPNAGLSSPPPSIQDFISELLYLDSATYVGNEVEFQFLGLTDYGPDVFVDDFEVEAVPNCPPPTSLVTSSIQGYQANLGWSSITGSSFEIEYGLQGFVQGTGGGTKVTTSSNPYTISGLIPVTCYDAYIRTICGPGDTSTWAGPITFCTTVSCPVPTNLSLVSATTTTAAINWTTGGASDYNYIVGPVGTTPATGTVMSGTTIPVTLTSLTAATSYVFWVRDSCGVGDVSSWVGPFNFSTLCNSFALNYTETFATWSGVGAPTCWDNQGGTQTVIKNGSALEFNFWGWPTGNDAIITSPAITISQKARLKLKWSSTGSTFYNDTLIILSKPTLATTWDTLAVWGPTDLDCACGATNTTPSSTPVDSLFTLDSNYVGSDIQIRLHGLSGYGPDVFINEVTVEVDPAFASCPAPQALTASNILANTADLSWTSTGNNFEISYGMGITNPGGGTVVTSTTPSYSVSGLNASTNYCYFVRQICSATDTSVWNGPYCFYTACGAVNAPWTESFNTGATAPQCWTNYNAQGDASANAFWKNTSVSWGNYGAQGVTDHTGNGGYAMGVDASTPYAVDVLLETPPIDITTLNNAELKFWIFMNNTNAPGSHNIFTVDLFDGTAWNDSIYSYSGDSVDWVENTVSLSPFTITGPIQIRFSVYKVGAPVNFYDDIMIDDVSIDNGGGACPDPTNVAATNITCSTVDITWNSDAGTILSGMIYDTAGFNPLLGGTIIPGASSPQTITGLMPSTDYDFYVIDSCSAGMSNPVMVSVLTAFSPYPTMSVTSGQIDTTLTNANYLLDASASTDYTSVKWEFGDGSPDGTNAMETHAYTANGSYTVKLTLTNGCGSIDSTWTIDVFGIGVEESLLGRTLNVFPNPTAGNVNISFNVGSDMQNVSINVIDALGRTILAKDLNKVFGTQNVVLDLSGNATGVYMIKIVTDQGSITKRVTLRNR